MSAYKTLTSGFLFLTLLLAGLTVRAEVSYQQYVSAGLNLISIGVQTDRSPESFFGDNLIRIWEKGAGGDAPVTPEKLVPGVGYWALMRTEGSATMTGVEVHSPYDARVSSGTTLAGNPFHVPMPWKDVFLCFDGVCLALQQAHAAGWAGRVRTYSDGRWEWPDLANGSLGAGEGFSLNTRVEGAFLKFGKALDWTIMLYLDGDDPAIQSDMLIAVADMAAKSVGSNAHVNVVAQLDRIPGDPSYGGWTIAHRFFVTPGMEPLEVNAVMDWGDGGGGREVDMSRPETLADFIRWAAWNYPAGRYVLLIADHGYGWQGLTMDTTSLGDFMTVKELKDVLEKSPVHFDVLALDACLMQMAEVLYELRACPVGLVVASEASGRAWPLADILEVPLLQPDVSSEQFARSICDLYVEANVETDITMSVFELVKAAQLAERVKALAAAMFESGCDDPGAYDVVRTRAHGVLDCIGESVLYSRNGSDYAGAGGVTVYFPQSSVEGMPETFFYHYQDEAVSFAREALWRDFLYSYYNPMTCQQIFNRCMARSVYDARNACLVFDEDHSKIDLYDFCRRLVESP